MLFRSYFEAISLGASNAQNWTLLGFALEGKNDPETAFIAFSNALTLDPGYVPAQQGRARDGSRERGARAGAAAGLAALAGDPSETVRRNVAEALGTMQLSDLSVVEALASLVNDEDGQTGYQAAYSLARLGPAAATAVPALEQGLESENRYVRNHSVEALRQIGTPQAQSALLDFLTASRWCPLTSKESTF